MKGAREFAELFETGQYGKLYITSGSHARGATFRIQVLPGTATAISNGPMNTCLNVDAVDVYGIISGQPGWTAEAYGWIHKGPWVEDFNKLVADAQIAAENKQHEAITAISNKKQANKEREAKLLAAY